MTEQVHAQLTSIRVSPGSAPGSPVRVALSSGLVAARVISRARHHAEVALVAGGALLLGGDHVEIRVEVAAGLSLTLLDVGGTVAYDGDGQPCRWTASLVLGPGATLTWPGLPFVVATGADVVRTTTARLGRGARLHLRETIVLGRSGEAGGRVVMRTDVADNDGPMLVEEVEMSGARPVPGVLGASRVLDTETVLAAPGDDGADEALITTGPPAGGAVRLELEHGGSVTRWLGTDTHRSPLRAPTAAAPPL